MNSDNDNEHLSDVSTDEASVEAQEDLLADNVVETDQAEISVSAAEDHETPQDEMQRRVARFNNLGLGWESTVQRGRELAVERATSETMGLLLAVAESLGRHARMQGGDGTRGTSVTPIDEGIEQQGQRLAEIMRIQNDHGSTVLNRFVKNYIRERDLASIERDRLINLKAEGVTELHDWEPVGYLDEEAARQEQERNLEVRRAAFGR